MKHCQPTQKIQLYHCDYNCDERRARRRRLWNYKNFDRNRFIILHRTFGCHTHRIYIKCGGRPPYLNCRFAEKRGKKTKNHYSRQKKLYTPENRYVLKIVKNRHCGSRPENWICFFFHSGVSIIIRVSASARMYNIGTDRLLRGTYIVYVRHYFPAQRSPNLLRPQKPQ